MLRHGLAITIEMGIMGTTVGRGYEIIGDLLGENGGQPPIQRAVPLKSGIFPQALSSARGLVDCG